jgi:DNA processing protein
MKVKTLTVTDPEFPQILKSIPQPPKQLYTLGNLEALLEIPRVAIVGSRKVTPYGRQVTAQLARELAQAGVVIISGLALGVDSIAHKACLEAGGKTIAVLPTSLDNIYPSSHRQLAKDILLQGGALISEYEQGMPGLKHNFIERNRLVSGLSDGVLITEAAIKSGTLHTAGFALEQGRTVMAVPGNITSVSSEGTNSLLKAGAIIVTETADILSALNLTEKDLQKQLPLAANATEQIILDLITAGTNEASAIHAASGLSPSEFNQTLTMLEISGKIRPLGLGNWGIK